MAEKGYLVIHNWMIKMATDFLKMTVKSHLHQQI